MHTLHMAGEIVKGLSSKHGISHATLFSTDAPRVTSKNLEFTSNTLLVSTREKFSKVMSSNGRESSQMRFITNKDALKKGKNADYEDAKYGGKKNLELVNLFLQ